MKQIVSPEISPATYYSIPQLAGFTNESEAVWRKRILGRRIPYTKLGRNVRVSRAVLELWLESRTVPPREINQSVESRGQQPEGL
jgi:hypothetical protein